MNIHSSENSQTKKDSLLFPTTLRRGQYLVRWLIWAIGLGTGVALLTPALALPELFFWAVFVLAMIYKILALDIPRLKDAGMSPLLLLLFLVPLANVVMVLLLFLAPSKKESNPAAPATPGLRPSVSDL